MTIIQPHVQINVAADGQLVLELALHTMVVQVCMHMSAGLSPLQPRHHPAACTEGSTGAAGRLQVSHWHLKQDAEAGRWHGYSQWREAA